MSRVAVDLAVLSEREFRVGGVVRKTFRIFSRNAVPFSLIGLLAWLPLGLVTYFVPYTAGVYHMTTKELALLAGGMALSYFLLQLIAVAAILPAAFQVMRRQPLRLGESIGRGLRQFFPLIGGGILYGLCVTLGFLLLAVPGLILFTRWYVFAPVCVVEQKGPLSSMDRSAELTKGNRWKIFAAAIIVVIAGVLIDELTELVLTVLHLPSEAAPRAPGSPIATLAIQGVFEGVWFAFNNIMNVVIYHDLRVAREGADIESIAAVFD